MKEINFHLKGISCSEEEPIFVRMEMIQNKVAESGILTLNLEDYLPKNLMVFDLKNYLFMEMILKEKDFRNKLLDVEWESYRNAQVVVHCSVDAIIPVWAYMLVSSYLYKVTSQVYSGSIVESRDYFLLKNIEHIPENEYSDKRVVIKGCGEEAIPEKAYTAVSMKLIPVVKSLMYGEPCSTVPIYKKKTI